MRDFMILPPIPGPEKCYKQWAIMYKLKHLGNFDELVEGIQALVEAAYKDGSSVVLENSDWAMKATREICDNFNVGGFSHSYRENVEDEFYPADDVEMGEIAEIILSAYKNAAQQANGADAEQAARLAEEKPLPPHSL